MKPATRFLELDALRGIAAVIIVVFHFTQGKNMSSYFNLGCIGVDIFFILSGFVIYMYIDNSKSWRTFLFNRFSRLYPAYWSCLLITTIFVLLKNGSVYFASQPFEWTNNLLIKYVVNTTMFQYFFSITNMDGSYWTLTIELLFYGFIALGIVTGKIKYIEWVGLIISLLCAAYAFDCIATHWFFHKLLIAIPLISFFNLFYAGIVLFKMKSSKITFLRCAILLLTYIIQCSLFENCYYNGTFLHAGEYYTMLALIYIIYILFLYNKLTSIVHPVLLWLGKISYPLYLIHNFLGVYVLIPAIDSILHAIWFSMLLSFIMLLFLASLINTYIEIPAMKYLKNKFSGN